MRKLVVVAVGIVVVGVVVRHCVADEAPDITYRLDRFPTSGEYTLTAIDATKVSLTYETPCGREALELPITGEPDELGVVDVEYPADREVPSFAYVRVDPKLAGEVTLGAIEIDKSGGTYVIAPDCGAKLSIDGRLVDVPSMPASIDDRPKSATLFVTARSEQCFVDQFVSYGVALSGQPKVLQGANAYWLRGSEYDVWFSAIPESVTVTTFGSSPSQGMKLVAALTECDQR